MGQRHQVFLVARVAARSESAAKPRYRCLAAYHHQWCYGRLPLVAARRFLTLIKQKDNCKVVREELRSLAGKYGEGTSEPKMPDVPCPYSTFLMASAWCVDLEPPVYGSGVSFKNSVMDAHMGSTEGQNNDGITVFDITDPADPSYCFVSTFGLESDVEVEDRVPLSAEQYCRAYYPVPEETDKEKKGVQETEEDVLKKIDALRNERLMALDVLAEAWPQEYECNAPADSTENTESDSTLASKPVIPSLADLSLKPAIEHGIQTGETAELEELVWHPGKADLMKPILQAQDPFPDSAMPLLTKIVQHEGEKKSLDLSGFSLSNSQLISLLTSTGAESVEVLDLSHSPITTDALRQILPATPKLRCLMLFGTSISDDQIYELLTEEPKLFLSLEELAHPAFLSWQDPALYPNGFAYVGLHSTSGRTACSASLAVFTPATVVQSLTDLLGPIADLDEYESFGFFGTSLVPQAALATGVRGEGQPWSERRVHCFPALIDSIFNGRGWIFAAEWPSIYDDKGSRYGFVSILDTKVSPPKMKICDLGAFLEEMAAEGRPSASDAAVKRLEKILADLTEKKKATVWTEEDFVTFREQWRKQSRFRY
ncbi:hypothetical protein K438DRAFT_1663649 [Mycena galopus ATCC 62051]|nr:hypothetical protein K438DRAFT_1663649 [Mycena galopus ATCC 62051]